MALEELGSTFAKLGQLLSARTDILPPALIHELVKLQDEVPPFSGEEAVRIVERELHRPVSELFSSFDQEPVASASIAQVHRARLPDGTPVAVKIHRPSIQRIVESAHSRDGLGPARRRETEDQLPATGLGTDAEDHRQGELSALLRPAYGGASDQLFAGGAGELVAVLIRRLSAGADRIPLRRVDRGRVPGSGSGGAGAALPVSCG